MPITEGMRHDRHAARRRVPHGRAGRERGWEVRRRKYEAGELITSAADAVREIVDRRYIMVWEKPMHPSWTSNWSVWVVNGFVGRHALRYAVPNKTDAREEPNG
jgi:hypothetical protein